MKPSNTSGSPDNVKLPDPVNEVQFHFWRNPDVTTIGHSGLEFLQLLPGPTHLHLTGKDSTRCRAVVTLQHGNEPSGLYAIFDILRQQVVPAVDIHFFIPSVAAAQQAPGFAYRMLPGHKDLNRCFNAANDTSPEDKLAALLIAQLTELNPEAVIDIHNTSGSGPAFGVTTFMDDRHDALVSYFTHRMIVTDLKLGSLMEISETMMPTVTIECGGAEDSESGLLAYEGLQKFVEAENVLKISPTDFPLEFFHNPIRLEVLDHVRVGYAAEINLEVTITLLPDIDNHNFGFVDENTVLGFVKGDLADHCTATNSHGENRLADFLHTIDGELRPNRRLKLFMITTNPIIAQDDCLFYMVAA